MKKIYKPVLIFCAAFLFLGMNSCDLLEQLFVNLALKETITAEGSDNLFGTESDCLSNYDTFNDYKDDIQSITYVAMAYYSLDFTPGLTGTSISATIYDDCTPEIIFQVFLPTANAADYVNNPFEIELTPDQRDQFNQYLADHETCDCFRAELLVEQVSASTAPPYFLQGVVEIVVEIEAKI